MFEKTVEKNDLQIKEIVIRINQITFRSYRPGSFCALILYKICSVSILLSLF